MRDPEYDHRAYHSAVSFAPSLSTHALHSSPCKLHISTMGFIGDQHERIKLTLMTTK